MSFCSPLYCCQWTAAGVGFTPFLEPHGVWLLGDTSQPLGWRPSLVAATGHERLWGGEGQVDAGKLDARAVGRWCRLHHSPLHPGLPQQQCPSWWWLGWSLQQGARLCRAPDLPHISLLPRPEGLLECPVSCSPVSCPTTSAHPVVTMA